MNSKERVAAAMRHELPDRVPVMCQLTLGHYFLHCGLPEIEVWHSTEAFGEALITMQRRYHFDGILVNLPGRDPHWSSYIRRVEECAGEKKIHWANGCTTVCPRDDNPHVYREDGAQYSVPFETIEPEKLFYIEPHAMNGITYPSYWGFLDEPAREEDFFPPWQFDTIEYILQRTGEEVSIHSEIFSPFTQFLELLNYTHGLMALVDDPGKVKACLEALTRGTIALGRGQAARGVDAVLISSAFAGAGFISPDHYREFVLPYEKKVIEGIRSEFDVPVYTHTCGQIGDRLELIQATGTLGIDTLDPPPLGNVELADAKERIGSQLFIKGNLDPVNVVLNGTPETVLDEAKHCLEVAASGGGYILSSACSIAPHSPPDNILKLHEAVERFGRYD
ncbi:MAG: uroporphyrinogen decarboxylase family protein [Acidobacteriia bacterium]|nr:uroporphyrinogen decarboxylase family protein [Terriglobia bacterium]